MLTGGCNTEAGIFASLNFWIQAKIPIRIILPTESSMPMMNMASHHSAPVDKCCDPVTKACLSSCSIACAMVADVACRPDAPGRLMKSVIVRGPAQPRLAAHEPGWLDPPPKPVV